MERSFMSRFRYHSINYHITAKIIITILALGMTSILGYFVTHDIPDVTDRVLLIIFMSVISMAVPLGIMWSEWYD